MGTFTLTGTLATFTRKPTVLNPTRYQAVLEPLEPSSATIRLGRFKADGSIVANDGVSPFVIYTEDGLRYAFRTLPELFPRVIFNAPADGATLDASDPAFDRVALPPSPSYPGNGQVPYYPVGTDVLAAIAAGDAAALAAAKAYADTVTEDVLEAEGTAKITVGDTAPVNPADGDLWVPTV